MVVLDLQQLYCLQQLPILFAIPLPYSSIPLFYPLHGTSQLLHFLPHRLNLPFLLPNDPSGLILGHDIILVIVLEEGYSRFEID
jgi:hypothetical protein